MLTVDSDESNTEAEKNAEEKVRQQQLKLMAIKIISSVKVPELQSNIKIISSEKVTNPYVIKKKSSTVSRLITHDTKTIEPGKSTNGKCNKDYLVRINNLLFIIVLIYNNYNFNLQLYMMIKEILNKINLQKVKII